MLTAAARKTYMLANFDVTDWSDADHADVAYFLDCNCPLGVQLMRPQPPPMMSFDAAVVTAKAGPSVHRSGAATILTKADTLATDWMT